MLSNLESIIGEGLKSFSIFAPILALLGGILTSISPCSLASIPLIIGFMTGTKEDDTKRAFKTSVVFAIGMAITYTTLGVLAALLSKIFNQSGQFWNLFLGTVMILMALQTWEVINVMFNTDFSCITCDCCFKRKFTLGSITILTLFNR